MRRTHLTKHVFKLLLLLLLLSFVELYHGYPCRSLPLQWHQALFCWAVMTVQWHLQVVHSIITPRRLSRMQTTKLSIAEALMWLCRAEPTSKECIEALKAWTDKTPARAALLAVSYTTLPMLCRSADELASTCGSFGSSASWLQCEFSIRFALYSHVPPDSQLLTELPKVNLVQRSDRA